MNGGEEFSDSFDVVVFLDCAVIDDDWTSLNSFWVVAATIVDVNPQANNLVDDNIVQFIKHELINLSIRANRWAIEAEFVSEWRNLTAHDFGMDLTGF